jgi:hypothetical protein
MNAKVVRAGIAGGAVMAIFSMMMLWLAGSGFWTPLNLIAHTFWRAAPLDGTLGGPAMVIGMAVHVTMAMLFGTLIAAAAQAFMPWVFAVADLLFGLMAASFAAIWVSDADTRYELAYAGRPSRGAAARPPAGSTASGRRQVAVGLALSGCRHSRCLAWRLGYLLGPGAEVQGPGWAREERHAVAGQG